MCHAVNITRNTASMLSPKVGLLVVAYLLYNTICNWPVIILLDVLLSSTIMFSVDITVCMVHWFICFVLFNLKSSLLTCECAHGQ